MLPEVDLANKPVLVTGGSGMIGRPLVNLLSTEGAKVRVLDIVSRPLDMSQEIDYRQCDMEDRDAMIGQLDSMEYIFHLAGAKGGTGIGIKRAADFLTANLQSTLYLFKELRKNVSRIKRLLLVSSVGAYSGDRNVFKEEQAWEGEPHLSDYYGGQAKRFCELICKAYREQFGLDYVVVRPTNCFGPYDRFDVETGMVIPALIRRLEDGERPLVLCGNSTTMRDFLYSEDAARGMLLAMENGRVGEVYNLGTGKPKSVLSVAEYLAQIYGTKVVTEQSEDKSPWMRAMNMEKSEVELGFKAEWGLVKALTKTAEWYTTNKGTEKYDPFK